jgi:hypothetical protein
MGRLELIPGGSMSPPDLSEMAQLYVEFQGRRGNRRPVGVSPKAPRSGIKVRVNVDRAALESGYVFVLCRRGDGDLVIGASGGSAPLEALRSRLGAASASYEIAALPIAQPPQAVLRRPAIAM